MKRRIILLISTVAMLVFLFALTAFANADIDQHRSCSQCGMDRKAYGYSRMLIGYKDGTSTGVCSLHCAVTDIDANKGRAVISMMVADRNSRLLIEAEKAVWVIGGSKRGVMTQRAKWAFALKEAAQSFVDSNGGQIISWDSALQAAREDAGQYGSLKKR